VPGSHRARLASEYVLLSPAADSSGGPLAAEIRRALGVGFGPLASSLVP
jgi:hypothetical protein